MKLYKILLIDKREEFVPADSYSAVGGQYVFFANGQPIPDTFFLESAVSGISVSEQNYKPIPPGTHQIISDCDENWFIDPNDEPRRYRSL
jgi:hypothetical protein